MAPKVYTSQCADTVIREAPNTRRGAACASLLNGTSVTVFSESRLPPDPSIAVR